MGYIRNDAVVASVHKPFPDEKHAGFLDHMATLREEMGERYGHLLVGPIQGVNRMETWFFAPDGSKEGWEDSNQADVFRAKFIEIVMRAEYPELVHLRFGGDDGETLVVKTTDKP